jgi:hypothetical protein
VKLTDFGLSTGFHKTHDSSYYQQFKNAPIIKDGSVNNIDLTLSRKDKIATWKKNRRSLVFCFYLGLFYCGNS